DYAKNGPYIGVSGLYAFEFFDHSRSTDNSWGVNGLVGYRFMPNFSVELLYQYLNEFDTDPGHINAWALTADVKAYALTGRIQPYAVVGLGYINGSGSDGNPPT